ncbi:MAG TPA: acetate kinase [Micromonosporaceae bacterium]
MSGRVLVLNCGSSSVKYRLFEGASTLAKGLVQRIGEPGGDADDHAAALRKVMSALDLTGLIGVGHRVVHGGTRFSAPTIVDDSVLHAVRDLIPLAPLHNPANLAGMEVSLALLPEVAQVAVFDTAFHHTIPAALSTYAIDVSLARAHGVRRYGFHGTSHAYVSRRTAELLGQPPESVNVVTLHLGNGASACAVAGGRSLATSMGLTPLEGLVMGTRSGDLDPAVTFHLHRVAGMDMDAIDDLLNKHGGLLGLCGDNDMRTVLARRAAGDAAASLAFDVYCARIKSYVGAYAALLGHLDAIAFTAGVGENAPAVRAAALSHLANFGIQVDPERNQAGSPAQRRISPDGTATSVWVVPTDEELEIAAQTLGLLTRAG